MAVGLWQSAVHGIAGMLHPGVHLTPTCASHLVMNTQIRAHLFPLLPHSHVLGSRLIALQQHLTSGML